MAFFSGILNSPALASLTTTSETLQSKTNVKFVDLLCEGEIEGLVDGAKSVYLNDTPLQNADNSFNFGNVSIEQRAGTNSQEALTLISDVESDISVNTQLTALTGGIVRTVTNSDVTHARIKVRFPALFNQASNGNVDGASVNLKIELSSNGGAYAEVINDTVTGKALDGYERDYEVSLTGSAPWGIKVTRLTADSSDLKLQNDTFWVSYTEIIAQKFRYPNSALVGIQYDSRQFNSTPTRGYDVKLKKIQVPSNYDPITRVYTGIWNGTFQTLWSDNPAWCFYDLLTNSRYGLGEFIPASQIDKWSLYSIAQYCDELVDDGKGGTEPRFTCNIYIQTRAEAFKVLNDFVSIFRSMIYWSNGTISFGQDSPKDPVALFNTSNVSGGAFTYAGSSAKTRHTVALVSWNDPEDFYKQKVEYVEDADGIARYGVIQSEVVAMGCTSQGQARRVGKWVLYTDQYETETVAFSTGIEAAGVRPNDIVNIQDPTRAGTRNAGRISSATDTLIYVDADFTLPTDAVMYVTLPNGAVESKTVASKTGTEITLSSALSDVPQVGSVWMVSAPSVEVQTYRVISVSEGKDGNIDISALKYDANKYAYIEDGEPLPVRDYTNVNLNPIPPVTVTTEEALYTYQAEVRSKLQVSWTIGENANSYRVDYRKDNGNFTTIITTDRDVEILNTALGSYDIRVYSINVLGRQSVAYTEVTVDVLGKTAPPSDVTGLSYNLDPNVGIVLDWNDVADLDINYYEIRQGSTWATATFITKVKASSYVLGRTTDGVQTYLVKALDTSDVYSATAASVTVSITAAPAPTVTSSFELDNVSLKWNAVQGSYATAEYEVRYGSSWAAGTVLTNVNTTYLLSRISWFGARTFFVAAKDISGAYGNVGSVTVTVAAPSNPATLTYAYSDTAITTATVTLNWGAVTPVHGLKYYELSYDAVTQQVNSTTLTLQADWVGSKTFTIKTVDLLGNASTGLSTVATLYVPNPPATPTTYISQNQLYLKWVEPAKTSLPVWGYEVRTDLNFGASNPIYRGTGIQCSIPKANTVFGLNTYYIKTIDTENNYSSTYLTATYTVGLPTDITAITETFTDTSLTAATVTLTWADVSTIFGVDYYLISYGTVSVRSKATTITFPADWVGSRSFKVQVVDTLGTLSTGFTKAVTKSLPAVPTSFTSAVSSGVLNVGWTAPAKTTLPIWGYEVRADTNFGTTGFLFKGAATSCSIPSGIIVVGANNYYIKTIDTDNNYSSTYLTGTFTLAAPANILDFTTDFNDSSLTSATVSLDWVSATATFGVDYYLITYNGTSHQVKANTITLPADWVGSRSYTIKTVDTLGNKSSGYTESVTKLAPNAPTNFRAQVIDNNVLFYWDLPVRTTLPIAHILLKKGTTWATAEVIGTKSGGFTSIQEQVGGDYIYWIAAVDTDNIESDPISIATTVAEPPDFIFNGDFTSNFGGTKSSAITEEGAILIPINTTETWADHFVTRAWTSPQDQINAGYPIYIQPTTGTGYYEEVFDYGNILASSKINVDFAGTILANTPTVVCTISVSLDNITYINYAGLTSIYASNFRYVKVRITVNQTGTTAIYRLDSLYVRLDAKQINDADSKACLSTDTLGTIANFNKEFVDITSINVTPSGTTSTTAVYDFQDAILTSTYAVVSNVATITATAHGLITGQKVRLYFSTGTAPSGVYTVTSYTANTFTVAITTGNTSGNCLTYPQGFRIYLFNSAGTRVSGTASWAVRGY